MILYPFVFLLISQLLCIPNSFCFLTVGTLHYSLFGSQLDLGNLLFLESLYLQILYPGDGGRGKLCVSIWMLFVSGRVSASVDGAQSQLQEAVGEVSPLSDGSYLSVLGLATVPFQQLVKSAVNPVKGSVIYRKNNKSCFSTYLLDWVFHEMKLLPSSARAI